MIVHAYNIYHSFFFLVYSPFEHIGRGRFGLAEVLPSIRGWHTKVGAFLVVAYTPLCILLL